MQRWSAFATLTLSTMLLASSTGCSRSCPKQPVKPCPSCPPATVTISPEPPPCDLPAWPAKPVMGGVPEVKDGKETGRVLITRDGLAELGRYVAGALAWADAAGLCLGARK